jgi:alkanesulfonate monooxygenase SsuD/methylene tetrahydromethanopterin reductase-like flavin-dependent oxidoreductase (luciferase family)
VQFGIHLPLIGFTSTPFTLERIIATTDAARRFGYAAIAANDHLVFPRPWLDGPTALSAVIEHSGDMMLTTTVALPVVRGPVALAKAAAAIDLLSAGRMVLGVGPGSSPRDYAAVGVDWEQRWKQLDESVDTMRALLRPDGQGFSGRFYQTEGVRLEPRPAAAEGIPIWIGSWGSEAGLRRVARRADGWLASAYNTTPHLFAEGLERLNPLLEAEGKRPETFPNGLATTLLHLTEDPAEADHVLHDLVVPTLNRPAEQLRDRLLIGSAAEVTEKVGAYAEAGLKLMHLWPLLDEPAQVEAFATEVAPHFTGTSATRP